MTKNVDWKGFERKAYRDAQQDGLMELVSGFAMFYLSGMVTGHISVAFVGFIVIFMKPGLEALRRRFTYPRIGYVKFPEEEPKEVWMGIFLAILGLLVVLVIVLTFVGEVGNFESWLKWIPAFLGIVYVGMFLSLADKSRNTRYYGFAVFSVIIGFTFSLITFESWRTGIGMYFLSVGAILIITGFVLFLWFLHTNPPLVEESSLEEEVDITT